MKVIDNALGANQFNFVQSELTSGNVPWHFLRDTAVVLDYKSEDNFSFCNGIYDVDYSNSIPHTPLFTLCYNALLGCLDSCGVEIDELYRIRLNLYTRHHEKMAHGPHVDDNMRIMKVGILYLTTNIDSPTLFYDKLHIPGVDTNSYEGINSKQLTINKEVQSTENTFVLFDSNIYHSSTRPTEEAVRININYNFTLK